MGACVAIGAGCSSSTVVQSNGSGGSSCGSNAAGGVQTLFSGESSPGPLYVDSSNAYWIAGTTKLALRAGPKGGGCKAKTLIADLQIAGQVKQMVGDTTSIYLGTNDPKKTVVKIDKSTNKASVLVGPSYCSQGGTGLIAENSTHIVFVCKDTGGEVERVLKQGATGSDIVFAPQTPMTFYAVAADEQYAYIDDGGIGRQALDGSGGQSLFGDAKSTVAMALGDTLYWFKAGALWQGGITSFKDGLRYSQLVDPELLAADKKGAYVGDLGGGAGHGSIVAALVGKGGATVVASKQNHPTAIATDPLYIYWTDQNGTVRRVSRP